MSLKLSILFRNYCYTSGLTTPVSIGPTLTCGITLCFFHMWIGLKIRFQNNGIYVSYFYLLRNGPFFLRKSPYLSMYFYFVQHFYVLVSYQGNEDFHTSITIKPIPKQRKVTHTNIFSSNRISCKETAQLVLP